MFNSKKLKRCREALSQSQEDLVRQLNELGLQISRQTLCNWEAGSTIPDGNDIAIIAAHFGKPVQFFFTEKSTKQVQ